MRNGALDVDELVRMGDEVRALGVDDRSGCLMAYGQMTDPNRRIVKMFLSRTAPWPRPPGAPADEACLYRLQVDGSERLTYRLPEDYGSVVAANIACLFNIYEQGLREDGGGRATAVEAVVRMLEHRRWTDLNCDLSHLCGRGHCVKGSHLNVEPHDVNMSRERCFSMDGEVCCYHGLPSVHGEDYGADVVGRLLNRLMHKQCCRWVCRDDEVDVGVDEPVGRRLCVKVPHIFDNGPPQLWETVLPFEGDALERVRQLGYITDRA
jgi:hypothetical protein